MLWGGLESFSSQAISFVVGILLARLLTPYDYGLVGMMSIFIAVSQTLIDSGMSNALIRKTNRTEVDCSTVFYFNTLIGVVLYSILFVSAPLIADFFNESELTAMTRVISIPLVINSLAVVQQARLTIAMNFKKQSLITIIASLCGGGVGVFLAYEGCGVWALVYSMVVISVIRCFLLWMAGHWVPMMTFSMTSFRELFSFGSKLLASGLLDTTYNNVRPILIGKFYSGSDLGFYSRANSYAALPANTLMTLMSRVTYPMLCKMQDDNQRLATNYRLLIRLAGFVFFPIMLGIAAVAEPLVIVLITEKWLSCVLLLKILCLVMILYPIHALNLNLLQVKGRSDLFLRLEVIKKVMGIVMLIVTVPMGVAAICWGGVITSVLALFINTYYTGILIQVGIVKQMRDLLPSLLLAGTMFLVVWGISMVVSGNMGKLIVGITAGCVYYISVARMFRMEELSYLIDLLINNLFKRFSSK